MYCERSYYFMLYLDYSLVYFGFFFFSFWILLKLSCLGCLCNYSTMHGDDGVINRV